MVQTKPRVIRSAGGRSVKHTRHSEEQVYQFIVQFKMANDGLSPTLREIADGVGISSTSVVSYLLIRMERRGVITVWDAASRGIMVVGGKWRLDSE